MSEIDRIAAYEAWAGSDDFLLRLSTEHGFQGGWHARDEKARQEQDDLREILDEHRKALRACKEERGRKTAEKSELRGERDRERVRAEVAEERVRGLIDALFSTFNLANRPRLPDTAQDNALLNEIARVAQNALAADPAATEAMREAERADGGGEEATGEDRPALRFAPGTRLIWYPRSRSRPHYDERVPAVVVSDDGDGPWLMVRVRTKAGREIERWVERGELGFELTDEASGAGEPTRE